MIARRDQVAEADELTRSLKHVLLSFEACNLMTLADCMDIDTEAAGRLLHECVRTGHVEVLNPVGTRQEVCTGDAYRSADTFFRWIRPGTGSLTVFQGFRLVDKAFHLSGNDRRLSHR